MNRVLILALLVCVALGTVWYFARANKGRDNLVRMQINNTQLRVELADTPDKITQGLSGRAAVTGDGMLFKLPRRSMQTFWMKDMLFDLDIVWIDDNIVVDISANVPKPKTGMLLANSPTYSPKSIVTHVLEVPAGWCKAHNVEVGAKVSFLQ